MSGERLREGMIHPRDLVRRLQIEPGLQVLALGLPRPLQNALAAAVGRRGRVHVIPKPCDVAIIWDDDARDERIEKALAGLRVGGCIWILAARPARKFEVPGSVAAPDLEAALRALGLRGERTVALGPGRYALRLSRRQAP